MSAAATPSGSKKFEWDDHYDFPRDLVGYGENSFNPQWPNGAKIAVSFVINYEEVCLRSGTYWPPWLISSSGS